MQRYFYGLRLRVTLRPDEFEQRASGASEEKRGQLIKYGRYLPWNRGNVDQVPLPFVNDMDITYKMKGAKRVAINQLGPALT